MFIMIFFSESFVDWIKHGFIIKFNNISPKVYSDFRICLAYDMIKTKQNNVILLSVFSPISSFNYIQLFFILKGNNWLFWLIKSTYGFHSITTILLALSNMFTISKTVKCSINSESIGFIFLVILSILLMNWIYY